MKIPTTLAGRTPIPYQKPVYPVFVQMRLNVRNVENAAKVVLYGTALAGLLGLAVGLEGCKLAARLIG
jgi:hypothetical protein